MRLQVMMFNQDDPKKCTAAKLIKFKLAKKIKRSFPKTMILNPFSENFVLPKDKTIDSVTGIDCSWNLAEKTFVKRFLGIQRKLPPLLAGNPVNFSKLNKLTTVEALAGASFVMGFENLSLKLLNKFSWGHTFYELNKDLLNEYSKATTQDEILSIANDYHILPKVK